MPMLKFKKTNISAALSPVIQGKTKTIVFDPLYSGEFLDVQQYDYPAVVDIDSLLIEKNAPALLEHDEDQICGVLQKIEKIKDNNGLSILRCEAVIGGTPYADLVIDYFERGNLPLRPSLGATRYRNENVEFVEAGAKKICNGRILTGPFYFIKKASLVEASFVPLPGDAGAQAYLAARLKKIQSSFSKKLTTSGGTKKMTFDEFLQKKGISPESYDSLSEEEKAVLQNEFQASGVTANADEEKDKVTANADEEKDKITANADEDETLASASLLAGEDLAETAVKEAVAEAVTEAIDEMPAADAAELYVGIETEISNEIASELADEDPEKVAAKAKRIAAGLLKKKILTARLKKNSGGKLLAENRRIQAISAACKNAGKYGAKILPTAIQAGWSLQKTEKVLASQNKIKAGIRRPVAGISGGTWSSAVDAPRREEVIKAALAIKFGLKPETAKKLLKTNDKVIEAALSGNNKNITLKSLIHESVNSFKPGYAGINSNIFDVFETMKNFCYEKSRMQKTGKITASLGFSTVSATDVLHALVEAFMLAPNEYDTPVYPLITKTNTFTDFNSVDMYQATLRGRLSSLTETGQIENVTFSTEKFTGGTEAKGITFAIPQQVLINDRLDVMADLLNQLNGLPDQCLEHDVAETFWKLLDGDLNYKDGSAYFSSARGNLISGADSALGEAGLSLAEAALDSFKNDNGMPLRSSGSFIVTGSKNFAKAMRIYTSEHLNIADTVGETNIYKGLYKPYKWKYLNAEFANAKKADGSTNSWLATNAATAWFLFRDPQTRPVLTVNKLNGFDSPQIKQFEADPSTWGTVYQVIYPYKICPVFYDGVVVSKGAV